MTSVQKHWQHRKQKVWQLVAVPFFHSLCLLGGGAARQVFARARLTWCGRAFGSFPSYAVFRWLAASSALIASSMSWVMNSTVLRRLCQTSSRSSCIIWRVWLPSAPNGSSINKMRGSLANARASATRWRIPPESSLG